MSGPGDSSASAPERQVGLPMWRADERVGTPDFSLIPTRSTSPRAGSSPVGRRGIKNGRGFRARSHRFPDLGRGRSYAVFAGAYLDFPSLLLRGRIPVASRASGRRPSARHASTQSGRSDHRLDGQSDGVSISALTGGRLSSPATSQASGTKNVSATRFMPLFSDAIAPDWPDIRANAGPEVCTTT